MSKTRIIIIQLKEIIYTSIFIGLGLLLILLLLIMFRPNSNDSAPSSLTEAPLYHAGMYSSQFELGSSTLNLEVLLDANHVNSVRLVNLNNSVATMYPLMEPVLAQISEQLSNGTSPEDILLSSENQYTQSLLLEVVKETIAKGEYTD